jgi:hypothetical protein
VLFATGNFSALALHLAWILDYEHTIMSLFLLRHIKLQLFPDLVTHATTWTLKITTTPGLLCLTCTTLFIVTDATTWTLKITTTPGLLCLTYTSLFARDS